ncbi:hypothetical protein Tco_1569847 [Tanacetum coccineum]
MAKSTKRHEQNSNLIKEIRAATETAIKNQDASIKALEIQIEQMSKVPQERRSGSLPCSTETNLRDYVKSISTTVETDIGGIMWTENIDAYSIETILLNNALPPKEKDLGSFTLPCYISSLCFNTALADLGASVSVIPFSAYTKLGLGELAPTKLIVELADRTVKRPKGIAENVLVGINKFVFPVEFIVQDMPKDIKTSLILRRPFLSNSQAKIDVFKRKITLRVGDDKVVFKSDKPTSNIIKRVNEIVDGLDKCLSYCDFDRKIHKDCAYNLPTFVGNFSVVTDFVVVENMDAYRDDGMGDVIVGRPFCKEACVKARRFDEMITIYKRDDSVTYQIARSHPRFKHLTNAQRNKVRPLLKVSTLDEWKDISHPYQKLKGFYKEVFNLGPEYIKDEKVEEWLTRGHVSIHEME